MPLIYDPTDEHTCEPPKFGNMEQGRKGTIWSCPTCQGVWEFRDFDLAGMVWYQPKPWNLRFRRHMRKATR